MLSLAIAVVCVLGASALASGTEAALFAVTYGKVLSAVEDERRGAEALKRIKNAMARPIMAIVVINNIANIMGSMAVGVIAGGLFESTTVTVFSAVLTLMVIVYAEIIPKTVAERYALAISLAVAPALLVLTKAMSPLLLIIDLLVKPVIGEGKMRVVSQEEIRALTAAGRDAGSIDADDSELIQRVFALNEQSARSIMTPIHKVDLIESTKTLAEIRPFLAEVSHSRLPVYGESVDDVQGVVLVRDLLQALVDGGGDAVVRDFAIAPDILPATLKCDDLIQHFRATKQMLALLADEGGTVLGVVTMEDVLEELVGEIVDETDVEQPMLTVLSERTLIVDAAVPLRVVNEALGTKLEGARVGELIIESLGRIPAAGETVILGDVEAVIIAANPRRIERVRLDRTVEPAT